MKLKRYEVFVRLLRNKINGYRAMKVCSDEKETQISPQLSDIITIRDANDRIICNIDLCDNGLLHIFSDYPVEFMPGLDFRFNLQLKYMKE